MKGVELMSQTESKRLYQREWHRKYREKNRASLNAKRREKYAESPSLRKENYKLHRQWVEKNRERVRRYLADYVAKNKDKLRNYRIAKKFSISLDDYYSLLESQDGKCAICKNAETARRRSGAIRALAVDHDHKTGRIRGLLCSSCNLSIGGLNEDISLLKRAIEYLETSLDLPTQ